MFAGVDFGSLGVFFLKLVEGGLGGDYGVKGFFQLGVFLEDGKIVLGGEAVSLVTGGGEVGDEDFVGRGVFKG